MGGDYSRTSFDPLRDHSGVGMQQGHLTTDADWNELVDILVRRIRVGTVDTVGRAIVPQETPTGFEIQLAPGPKIAIGRGRMYVDGFLAENHGRIGTGADRPIFDRRRLDPDGNQTGVLDEMISTVPNDFIDFAAQPYLPNPPALPSTPGPHIVYLQVWQRELTAVKDPRLLERALGGADTATRSQTAWQVKILPDVGAGAACGSQSAKWDALIAPSPARLTTDTIDVEDPADPCLIPPGGGYRGLENHFYRVEIHSGGALGAANFKWSRDNGSVAARIESIEPGNRVRVRSIGRDSNLRFEIGNWVEITNDRRELSGESGDMRRIVDISGTEEIELNAALSADLEPVAPDTTGSGNLRIFRWDQGGKVRFADGSLHVDLDSGTDGLIPVPAGGKAVQLEAGIIVTFTTEPGGGILRALDHWSFAARTEGAQIEMLDAEPPVVHHHYARLAVVTFPSSVSDCRIFWPPADECGCTVCVSAEGHNSGRYTIQDAVADLPQAGGTICLGPGDFILGATPVVIDDRQSVRLRGHGFGSELAYAGPGGAIRLTSSYDVRVTDLAVTVASAPAGTDGPDLMTSSAVHIADSFDVSIGRTRLKVVSGENGNDYGVSFEGRVVNLRIAENWIEAVTGIAFRAKTATPPNPNNRETGVVYNLRIADNYIDSSRAGISLEGFVLHLGPVYISTNAILAGQDGIRATGIGLGVEVAAGANSADNWSATGLWIEGNSIRFARGGSGITSGLPDLRVLGNDIVASAGSVGSGTGSCIRLSEGAMPLVPADAQIVGNRLGDVDGYALAIDAPQASLLVKQNVMRDCEEGAVMVGPNVSIRSLSFDNNLIERVATRESAKLRTAVRLSGVADARILGNTIRGVGSAAAGSMNCRGFDINGVVRLDLSHNLITDIGPGVQNAESIGVAVHGAVLACAITANTIYDTRGAEGQGSGRWCAISIQGHWNLGFSQGTATVVTGISGILADAATGAATGAATRVAAGGATTASTPPAGATNAAASTDAPPATPASFVVNNRIFMLGTNRLWAFAFDGEMELQIIGNLIEDHHPDSAMPMVQIGGRVGNCIFSENQCTLRGRGRPSTPLVLIQTTRIVAANNVIRRPFVAGAPTGDSMILQCASSTATPARLMATVTGNITTSSIKVNNVLLQPPFDVLNIRTN